MSNHSSSFQRQTPQLPHSNHATLNMPPSLRKTLIVEMLSLPPPLSHNPLDQEEINLLLLLRNTSISLRASLTTASTSAQDWSDIPLTDLIEKNKLIFIDKTYPVRKAFETLISHNLTSIPVSENPDHLRLCSTFDYSDLNTYLLLIMDKIPLSDLNIDTTNKELVQQYTDAIKKAKKGEDVSVPFITLLTPKNPFIKFSENDVLYLVMETLGNGVHRIAITDSEQNHIVGILSQRRLIKFMWDNARRFPLLDFLLSQTLEELDIGQHNPITIYEDENLIEALYKMFKERISSLAVVDRLKQLVGNISIVDVQNVSLSKNSYLLFKSVLHFILYNLSQKGIEQGQDQFPIFHVNKQTLLGRVIAKLVATRLHRLWIVQLSPTHKPSVASSHLHLNHGSISGSPQTIEGILNSPNVVNGGGSSGGQEFGRQGNLIGVITLTDILGLFALSKSGGKRIDPLFARNQRRRSLTSTTRSSSDVSTSHELFRKQYSGGKNES